MKKAVLFVFAVLVGVWLAYISMMVGIIPQPEFLALTKPDKFSELGDSLAAIDGLFTAIAILLGLVAILLQGRELQASTEAQTEQAMALKEQMQQQETSNRLNAYTARLQYLIADNERLERQAANVKGQIDNFGPYDKGTPREEDLTKLWDILKATQERRKRQNLEVSEIDAKIKKLLA